METLVKLSRRADIYGVCCLCSNRPRVSHYYILDVSPIIEPVGGALRSALFGVNQGGQMIWISGKSNASDTISARAYLYQNCESRDLRDLGGGPSIPEAPTGEE